MILFGEGVPNFVGILDFKGVLDSSIFAKFDRVKDPSSPFSTFERFRAGETIFIGEPGGKWISSAGSVGMSDKLDVDASGSVDGFGFIDPEAVLFAEVGGGIATFFLACRDVAAMKGSIWKTTHRQSKAYIGVLHRHLSVLKRHSS